MVAYNYSSLTNYQVNTDVKSGFPVLFDDVSLAFQCGINNKQLWYLLQQRNNEDGAYNCFGIPEYYENGDFKKVRHIQAPTDKLMKVHKVLNGIFTSVEHPRCVTAYVKGLSYVDAAKQHERPSFWFPVKKRTTEMEAEIAKLDADPRYKAVPRNRVPHDKESPEGVFYYMPLVAIQLDLQNFFNSVRACWVRHYFRTEVGYSHHVASLLASLCTVKMTEKTINDIQIRAGRLPISGDYKPRAFLPQGSPLSGSLSNLVAYSRFGRTIENLLIGDSPDWVFTIYSDDIAITHPAQTISVEKVEKVKNTMIQVVEDAGFKVNRKKTKVKWSKNDQIVVLGVVMNEKVNLKKKVYKDFQVFLHKCATQGWDSVMKHCEAKNPAGVISYARGTLQHFKKIRPDRYEALNKRFEEALEKFPVEKTNKVVMVDKTGDNRVEAVS